MFRADRVNFPNEMWFASYGAVIDIWKAISWKHGASKSSWLRWMKQVET